MEIEETLSYRENNLMELEEEDDKEARKGKKKLQFRSTLFIVRSSNFSHLSFTRNEKIKQLWTIYT